MTRRKKSGNGMDRGNLERFLVAELGEHAGHPLGEHRLTDARRAVEEQVMATCGSHLNSVATDRLPEDL